MYSHHRSVRLITAGAAAAVALLAQTPTERSTGEEPLAPFAAALALPLPFPAAA